MRDNYDFSKGVKNPYADKLKDGYAVTVHYDFANPDKNNTDGKVVADEKQSKEDLQCLQSRRK